MGILEQSRGLVPDTYCVKCTLPFALTFCLAKIKDTTKYLQYSSLTIYLRKGAIFAKNANFLQNNADISKIKRALVLKSITSETKYGYVLPYQISSFYHNSKRF